MIHAQKWISKYIDIYKIIFAENMEIYTVMKWIKPIGKKVSYTYMHNKSHLPIQKYWKR